MCIRQNLWIKRNAKKHTHFANYLARKIKGKYQHCTKFSLTTFSKFIQFFLKNMRCTFANVWGESIENKNILILCLSFRMMLRFCVWFNRRRNCNCWQYLRSMQNDLVHSENKWNGKKKSETFWGKLRELISASAEKHCHKKWTLLSFFCWKFSYFVESIDCLIKNYLNLK